MTHFVEGLHIGSLLWRSLHTLIPFVRDPPQIVPWFALLPSPPSAPAGGEGGGGWRVGGVVVEDLRIDSL